MTGKCFRGYLVSEKGIALPIHTKLEMAAVVGAQADLIMQLPL